MRSLFACFLLLAAIGCAQDSPSTMEADARSEKELAGVALVAVLEDQRLTDSAQLKTALRAGDEELRARAARAMGRIQSPAYAEALAASTRDEASGVRQEALFALGQLGLARGAEPPAVAVDSVREAIAGGEGDLVPWAAEALGKLAPEGAADQLVPLLSAESSALREKAVHALLRLRFVPVWRGQVDSPPELPAAATHAVTQALDDPAPEVRRAAAHLFSRFGGPASIEALAAAASDDDEWVRLWSLRALGRSEKAPASALMPGFSDASPRVRAEAVLAANRLGAQAAVPLELAKDPSFHVRRAVAEAFAGRSDASELDTLRALAQDESPAVRAAAVAVLAQRLGDKYSSELETIAQDADWRMRLAAAPAAGTLKEAGRPILERLAQDSDTRVANAALEQLADQGSAEHVERALLADDLAVRGTAVQMVPRAGLADPIASLEKALEGSSGEEWIEIREGVVDVLAELEAEPEILLRLAAEDPAPSVRARTRTVLANRGIEMDAAEEALEIEPSPLLEVRFEGTPRVELETSKGKLVIRLMPSEAPVHVANFLEHVEAKFYDGLLWHRVVTNFVIQGGDPRGDGWGSAGRTLRDEIHPAPFVRGTVGMPKAGKDTGGCQLFITHIPTPHLDGNYTVFGQVEEGLDVLDLIEVGDQILHARRL